MSVPTPLFSPTLESVQQAFDDWRATRGKRGHTPISLQRRAAALRDTHRDSHICSALKINDTALKRWSVELASVAPLASVNPAAFVELPTLSTTSRATDSSGATISSISIDLGDAIALRVQGCFTLEQIFLAARQHQQGAA